ncbi:uncharacterized protein LAJ45_04186 [Morchella importuna]|uniref:uncharacterized protein n=1 Tax=Morchella importuna TaxID=1174673 RepID=UPI001E8D6386|nr:uncharacterized protein LAJ45_04186 [Morchella importuna]KAH8151565.1 hypothetical protein LAJ45_04186 [Morchella importuna]
MKLHTTLPLLSLFLLGTSVICAPTPEDNREGGQGREGNDRCRGRGCDDNGKDIVITTTAPGGLVVTMTLPIGDFFGGSPSATGDAEGLAETGNGSDDNGDNGSSDRNGGGNSNGSDDEIDSDNSNRGGSSGRGGRGRKALFLSPANVQSNSAKTGQEETSDPTQADSLTDSANFINFCTDKTLTNGQQIKSGSCNGIPMGDIPSTANMVSTIIISPGPGEDIPAETSFDIEIQVLNLVAGSFTNPASTYYSAPQTLKDGKIVGHTHVVIQRLSSLNPSTPPDPAAFEFFKGINDAGDGSGGLKATVSAGLEKGFYRVCTMSSAANHQPVLMPVAQRGAQDDCQRFSVGKKG